MTRIEKEKRMLGTMILLYCRRFHGPEATCDACRALLDYAGRRLDACRYGESKTSCLRCPTHCYAPARREAMRAVMRFAGPRMLLRRPLEAILHLLG